MTLDQRLTDAARHVADGLVVPEVDLDAVRSDARANRRQRVAIAVTVVVAAIVVTGTAVVSSRDASAPEPALGTPSPSPTPSTATREPIDTSTWTPYKSELYHSQAGSLVGYPPYWTVVPATRTWRFDTDVADPLSPAYESFIAPTGHVRVSVWEVPLDTVAAHSACDDLKDTAFRMCVESVDYVLAWVDDYCQASGISTPCGGIEDRAVELCLEKRDCHPGVMVPFDTEFQAFFSGGIYNADAMTVVAVWRGESDRSVARYGGAQRLLEGFLSTMQVWPASTPPWERTAGIERD